MTEQQDYRPYRQSILSKDQLRALSKLRPMRAAIDTMVSWAIILAAWYWVAQYPTPLAVLMAIPVIGTSYYALAIVGHDGLHRRLTRSTKWNDLWCDIFLVGPVGAITRMNRTNHIFHHLHTCLAHDPDRHKYTHANKETTFGMALFLCGLANLLPTARNIFLSGKSAQRNSSVQATPTAGLGYTPRDVVILLGTQGLIFSVLTFGVAWWAYPVLWLAPVYLFTYCADLIRVFCEHSVLGPDEKADSTKRLITFKSNLVERAFFAPNNMNYHAAHHLWPSIPYYNLPKAHDLICKWQQETGDPVFVTRHSYLAYVLTYYRWHRSRAAMAIPNV